MMCAKWAFLRTPEVEQHGEHRVFPMTPLEYVRAGRTKKAPKKNLRGFVIPIGFKPITF